MDTSLPTPLLAGLSPQAFLGVLGWYWVFGWLLIHSR